MHWMMVLYIWTITHSPIPGMTVTPARWMRVTAIPEMTYDTEAECRAIGEHLKAVTVQDARLTFDYACKEVK